MNKTEFNEQMIKAMTKMNLTQTAEVFILNLLHQGILWDLLKEIGVIEE